MPFRSRTGPLDRVLGSLAYLLPILTALPYGAALYRSFPFLVQLLQPLFAISFLEFNRFASLIVFFALFALVVRNPRINHFIRYNTALAIVTQIGLILCQLILQFFLSPVLQTIGLGMVLETFYTTLFLGVWAIAIFAWFKNIKGDYAEVPIISESAYRIVGM